MVTTLGYDPVSQRLAAIDSRMANTQLQALYFEYDAVGNVVRCVDPRGNDTRMVYNALDQRISMNVTVPKQTQGATFGEKVTKSFTYDANDNLVQVDHENRDQTGALDPINPLWRRR